MELLQNRLITVRSPWSTQNESVRLELRVLKGQVFQQSISRSTKHLFVVSLPQYVIIEPATLSLERL